MLGDLHLLVDGEWIGGSGRETLDIHNPATGDAVAQLPVATVSDVQAAAASSSKAFTEWRTQSPNVRADLLLRAAQLLRDRREQIARMLTIEQGKPLAESRAEVDTAAAYTQYYAGQAVRLPGYALAHPDDASIGMSVVAQPIGPSLILVPWNFPVAEAAVHMAPAIAAGCTVILKPPEEAPAAAIAYARCFVDAGAPHGVINVLAGDPVRISESLIADPRIRRVAFTGSTVVGRRLSMLAGQHLKQTVMELGGNAPFIVTADADIECAIAALVASKLRNAGQVCIAPNRIYVATPISSEFFARLVTAFEAVKVGDGQEKWR